MSLHSASKYQKMCTKLIENAIRYPRMYYRNLEDFRTYLTGHFSAYSELEAVENDCSFNHCFTKWLCKETQLSGSAGWTYVITELAEARGVEVEPLFFEYVQEFLAQWGDETRSAEKEAVDDS